MFELAGLATARCHAPGGSKVTRMQVCKREEIVVKPMKAEVRELSEQGASGEGPGAEG